MRDLKGAPLKQAVVSVPRVCCSQATHMYVAFVGALLNKSLT